MKADPQKEHRWLQKLVGEWTFESDAPTAPGQPPSKLEGSESVRPLGGLWVVAEGEGAMPGGGTARTMMTLGYDPRRERYVGTFVASVMTHLWIYEGSLDAASERLTLDTEGPSFAAEGGMAKYQDVITFEGDDHRVLTARVLGDDGRWHEFMTTRYKRKR